MCLTALYEHVRARAAFFLTVLVSAESACAAAQVPQERGVEILAPAPAPSPAFLPFDPSQSQGLFVGVRNFLPASGFPEVPYAVDDAVDLAFLFSRDLHLLEPPQVTLLLSGEPQKEESRQRLAELVRNGARRLDASHSTILKAFEEQSDRAGSGGLWFLTFASHGIGDRIMAADSMKRDLAKTSIHAAALLARLDQSKSQRRIVLLDVCREALPPGVRFPVKDPHSVMGEAMIRAITESEGEVILSAARRGCNAYDDTDRKNGVFSAAVLDALHCKAGHNENGQVTVDLLADFVNTQVSAWVDQHRPGDCENSGIERVFGGLAQDMALAQCHSPCETIDPRILVYSNRGKPDPISPPEYKLRFTASEARRLQNLVIRAELPETPGPLEECVCHWEKHNGFRQMWQPLEGADRPCTLSHPPPTPHESVVLRLTVGKTVHPPVTIEVY